MKREKKGAVSKLTPKSITWTPPPRTHTYRWKLGSSFTMVCYSDSVKLINGAVRARGSTYVLLSSWFTCRRRRSNQPPHLGEHEQVAKLQVAVGHHEISSAHIHFPPLLQASESVRTFCVVQACRCLLVIQLLRYNATSPDIAAAAWWKASSRPESLQIQLLHVSRVHAQRPTRKVATSNSKY